MNIHLGWIGGDPPKKVLDAVQAAKKANPEDDVFFHTSESIVPKKWVDDMNALSLPYLMRSDVLRHCALNKYGGLWLDADVKFVKRARDWPLEWDKYNAIRLHDLNPHIGSDIIYAPSDWQGWWLMEERIDRVLSSRGVPIDILGLAHSAIEDAYFNAPQYFKIHAPGSLFPFVKDRFTKESVVARGFETKLGLGDMVEAGLKRIGITKELAETTAKALGLRGCGCKGRQAALNEIGRMFGIGK